jgi:hypothetical protein
MYRHCYVSFIKRIVANGRKLAEKSLFLHFNTVVVLDAAMLLPLPISSMIVLCPLHVLLFVNGIMMVFMLFKPRLNSTNNLPRKVIEARMDAVMYFSLKLLVPCAYVIQPSHC